MTWLHCTIIQPHVQITLLHTSVNFMSEYHQLVPSIFKHTYFNIMMNDVHHYSSITCPNMFFAQPVNTHTHDDAPYHQLLHLHIKSPCAIANSMCTGLHSIASPTSCSQTIILCNQWLHSQSPVRTIGCMLTCVDMVLTRDTNNCFAKWHLIAAVT